MEGIAEEEEVDDQLLWNLQILSEVDLKSGSACDLHSLLQNGCDYWYNAGIVLWLACSHHGDGNESGKKAIVLD